MKRKLDNKGYNIIAILASTKNWLFIWIKQLKHGVKSLQLPYVNKAKFWPNMIWALVSGKLP